MITLKTRHMEKAAREISDELHRIFEQIEITERNFNEIEDSDLIEAAIYDRSALLKRYAYLLRELKKITGEPAKN